MKSRLFALAAILLGALSARATTLTIDSTLDVWTHGGGFPGDFAQYADVAVGDDVSYKINFSDSLSAAAHTNPALFVGAVSSLEYSIGGILRVTLKNLNVTLRNGYNGVDTIRVEWGADTTASGMMGSFFNTSGGYSSLVLTDVSATGLASGGPVDYAKFFDQGGDGFSANIGFSMDNPYADYAIVFDTQVAGRASLRAAPPQPGSGVPDKVSTLPLTLLAFVGLASLRPHRSKRTLLLAPL